VPPYELLGLPVDPCEKDGVSMSNQGNDTRVSVAAAVDRLWADPNILAVGVFGSADAGGADPASDVDLLVVEQGEGEVWKSPYFREGEALVHLQYFSRAQFLKNAKLLRGGPYHHMLASTRLLALRDEDLGEVFRRVREFPEADRSLRILEAAGNLCLDLRLLTKSLTAGPSLASSHYALVQSAKVLDGLARITLVSRGQIPGRAPLTEAAPLNPELAEAASGLVEAGARAGGPAMAPTVVKTTIKLAEACLHRHLAEWSEPLLAFLRRADGPLPLGEFEEMDPFNKLKTDLEKLTFRLVRAGLVRESVRPFTATVSAAVLLNEVVYSVG